MSLQPPPSDDRLIDTASRRAVILGDVLDDIIVVARSRPMPGTDTPARIHHRAGGSAANTSAWLAALGVRVDFVGRVGSGDVQRHSRLLADAGVSPRLSYSPAETTGTVVITIDDSSQTMLTDRGASAGLDLDDLTDDLVAGASVVHVTGYSIVHSRSPVAFRRLAARVRGAGALLSVDPASSGFIAEFGARAFLDLVDGADLFFPSLGEGRILTGLEDADEIVAALLPRFGVVALTLPDGGAVCGRRGAKLVHTAAAATRLVDPVGTGDSFSAGFIAAWLDSQSVALAARKGAKQIALVRAVVGGRPTR